MNDGFTFFGILIWVVVIVVLLAANWKIFEKAGKPGWASLIPIYNLIILVEIIGKPIWWVFMFFIPVVNIVFAIWANNLLSKSFGKDELFTVGLIFLSFIFLPILGFGDARYHGPAGKP